MCAKLQKQKHELGQWNYIWYTVRPKTWSARGRHGQATSLKHVPAKHLSAGPQIRLKYGPSTTRLLNSILIKIILQMLFLHNQYMTQVIIVQICIIDNEKLFVKSKNKVIIKQDAFYNSLKRLN